METESDPQSRAGEGTTAPFRGLGELKRAGRSFQYISGIQSFHYLNTMSPGWGSISFGIWYLTPEIIPRVRSKLWLQLLFVFSFSSS